jgi:hypothetical protein
MRFFAILAAVTILAAALAPPAAAAESNVFLKATVGGSYPIMQNLNNELGDQGGRQLIPGVSLSMSIGRMFSDHKWGLEFCFDQARYQSFRYENDYESFEGDMKHYNFMLVGKRSLLPSNDTFRPCIGAGIGYGYTNISRAGGKIDGLEGLLLLQLESRIKDNISILIESAFLTTFDKSRYDSSFLESSAYDAILDGNGDPLDERFTSIDLRIGIQAWLKPPSKYGEP